MAEKNNEPTPVQRDPLLITLPNVCLPRDSGWPGNNAERLAQTIIAEERQQAREKAKERKRRARARKSK